MYTPLLSVRSSPRFSSPPLSFLSFLSLFIQPHSYTCTHIQDYCNSSTFPAPDEISTQWSILTNRTHEDGQNKTKSIVLHLTNGNCYSFRVRALNDAGEGPPSGWSKIVVPGGVPSAPTVTATAGDRRAVIRWTTPKNGGRIISGYRIVLKRTNVMYPEGTDADVDILENWDVRTEEDVRSVQGPMFITDSNLIAVPTATIDGSLPIETCVILLFFSFNSSLFFLFFPILSSPFYLYFFSFFLLPSSFFLPYSFPSATRMLGII